MTLSELPHPPTYDNVISEKSLKIDVELKILYNQCLHHRHIHHHCCLFIVWWLFRYGCLLIVAFAIGLNIKSKCTTRVFLARYFSDEF